MSVRRTSQLTSTAGFFPRHVSGATHISALAMVDAKRRLGASVWNHSQATMTSSYWLDTLVYSWAHDNLPVSNASAPYLQ